MKHEPSRSGEVLNTNYGQNLAVHEVGENECWIEGKTDAALTLSRDSHRSPIEQPSELICTSVSRISQDPRIILAREALYSTPLGYVASRRYQPGPNLDRGVDCRSQFFNVEGDSQTPGTFGGLFATARLTPSCGDPRRDVTAAWTEGRWTPPRGAATLSRMCSPVGRLGLYTYLQAVAIEWCARQEIEAIVELLVEGSGLVESLERNFGFERGLDQSIEVRVGGGGSALQLVPVVLPINESVWMRAREVRNRVAQGKLQRAGFHIRLREDVFLGR